MDPKWFWTSPVDFGRVQIIKISPEKCYLNLQQNPLDPIKTNSSIQNNLDGPK